MMKVVKKPPSFPSKTDVTVEIAARYLVYKLFAATNGEPFAWHPLLGLGEAAEAAERAVERGWISVRRAEAASEEQTAQSAVLTDEGRRVARRALLRG